MAKKITAPNHVLIPKHVKISDKEKKEVFKRFNISFKELPKINMQDPGIVHLKLLSGDVVKIIRQSKTSGESIFYRGVTNV